MGSEMCIRDRSATVSAAPATATVSASPVTVPVSGIVSVAPVTVTGSLLLPQLHMFLLQLLRLFLPLVRGSFLLPICLLLLLLLPVITTFLSFLVIRIPLTANRGIISGKVLSFIIHPDQTCSIPGRSIFSNVTISRDTFDYIERTNETAILVSLDQKKAFDRVNRSFLLDLLVAVGFSPDFCRWIATLYIGAYMRIILNNWLTEQISFERAVRQGDPLSPLLYVL